MKKVVSLILFIISISLSGQNVYYVQDVAYNASASDENAGTNINLPWATWQKAFETADDGDTVYFRGGRWYPTTAVQRMVGGGTASQPICFFNYPGETPILDAVNFPATTGSMSALDLVATTRAFIKFRGLHVVNCLQTTENQWILGASFGGSSGTIYLDRMVANGHGGGGFGISGFDTAYVTNCDAHNNIDSTNSNINGGRGDGFNITTGGTFTDTSRIVYMEGCRSWYNSDDGFNLDLGKQCWINNCWSFRNGRLEGDGTGIKFAGGEVFGKDKRRITNCISTYNKATGFVVMNLVNEYYGPFNSFYNNLAYNNLVGYGNSMATWDYETGIGRIYYRNNIAFKTYGDPGDQAAFCSNNYQFPYYVTQDHNTWEQTGEYFNTQPNPTYTVTAADFVSLDTAQLSLPRQQDGSLPVITFGRLAAGSDLADGTDVGMSATPDIGVDWAYLDSQHPSTRIKLSPSKNGVWTISKRGNLLISR